MPIALGGETAFYIGSVLFVSVLIGPGIHLTMVTVVNEREEQTLPFVMSLPISVTDYTKAKIYFVSHIPVVVENVNGQTPVWGDMVVILLAVELLAAVVILAGTFVLQTRKKDFL